jgi:uncharacterized protein DUF6088
MWHISDMANSVKMATDPKARMLVRIKSTPDSVWTPAGFVDIASRVAVDKTLQRLVAGGDLRRIDRGLYDQPRRNKLTGWLSSCELSPKTSHAQRVIEIRFHFASAWARFVRRLRPVVD